MPLSPGDKLGPYEIVAPIGAGGMGEVYRAKDTKLDREVAIKVLPSALAQDPERLARFEREAKVLASLNHPNIAQIYGIEESSTGRALVMELVPGETLKRPLPLETALNYVKQIAEALEAAHDKSIIHRDLKPANIMVTPAGTVKVLDFGLAAVTQPSASSGDPSNSPTLTMRATQAGMILGTAGYMAPEQAAGQPVDKRADIWAFGVVLYEMLTGQGLFTGDSIAHILADVLRAPIDFDKLPKETPRAIRDLLKRCLDRDVKTRLRDIGEGRIAIQNVGKEPEIATTTGPPSRVGWLSWVAAAIFFITAAVLAAVHFREQPSEARSISTTLLPPENAEFDFNLPFALPALSPDGTQTVFGSKSKDGKRQLWLRRLDSATAQPLPGTDNAGYPFWSPDNHWVGFSQENKLKKIDIRGGPPVAITDLQGGGLRGASWSPRGVIVFGLRGRGYPLYSVAAAGGAASAITTLEQGRELAHIHPWFLPDGIHFLYKTRQVGETKVRLGSLDEPGKPGKVIGQAQSNGVYAQGHLLYLRQNTLMAQPFDLDRLETQGEATPLVEGVSVFDGDAGGFTVSASGLLLYQSGTTGNQSRLLWRDRQGKALGNLGEATGAINSLMLSPDGKRLAASVTDRSGNADLWIYDTDRGTATRFTTDPATDRGPVWSPDSSTIYFNSDRRGSFGIFGKVADGSGAEQFLLMGGGDARPDSAQSVSPDGKLLLFTSRAEKTGLDLWVVPLMSEQNQGKSEPRIFLQTAFDEQFAKFSPDGRWVAYQSNESGQDEVYAAPFPGPGGKRLISTGGGNHPRWGSDGKQLFYETPDGQLMAVEVAARNGTLEVGRGQKLFGGVITSGGLSYDVSTDGQKFVVVDGGASSVFPVTLLQNWPASLHK